MSILGIDIGGSGVKAGVVTPEGEILFHAKVDLAKGQSKETAPILEAATRAGREALEGAAGKGTRKMVWWLHLPIWRGCVAFPWPGFWGMPWDWVPGWPMTPTRRR
jgi:predicted NBD/HSP70 family sugar kinase